jgi:type VI secretion system VasD/TssJ family lipoprotein
MSVLRRARHGMLLAALTGIAGCGTTDKLVLTTSPRLNTCEGADPHPCVVKVYYLASADRFLGADFVALWENETETLGGDLLKLAAEKTLNPKQQLTLPLRREDAVKGATTIGIVANFCKPGEGCWRKAVPIGGGDVQLRVHLDEGCLSID